MKTMTAHHRILRNIEGNATCRPPLKAPKCPFPEGGDILQIWFWVQNIHDSKISSFKIYFSLRVLLAPDSKNVEFIHCDHFVFIYIYIKRKYFKDRFFGDQIIRGGDTKLHILVQSSPLEKLYTSTVKRSCVNYWWRIRYKYALRLNLFV
jgi:hypothetical protein